MSFDTLLGNEQLKRNLSRSLERGHISHFYLISGPKGSGKHTLAGLLAAAILCREGSRPCLQCGVCRRVLSGLHPDCITVDDPGKKTVPVDLIRQAREDMFTQPNESDYKIYLFPRAQDMGLPGQNALLKVLEEPPAYGVFLLLTENPERLLPTVRSRCTELKLTPLPEPLLREALSRRFPQAQPQELTAAAVRSGGFLGQAAALLEDSAALPPETVSFAKALCARSPVLLLETLAPMEKWKRDALGEILEGWLELTENALVAACGGQVLSPMARRVAAARSAAELREMARCLQKASEYTLSNVSPAAVCGYLQWALR